jgi:ATP synthase protein I
MAAQPPPANKSSAEWMRAIGEVGTIGLSFVFAIALGFGGGYFLDRWLGTHWIWIPGFLLGFAAAILNVYRTSRKYIK